MKLIRLCNGEDTNSTAQTQKTKKNQKKIFRIFGTRWYLLWGPITRLRGQILKFAPIVLFVWSYNTFMPNFLEIRQVPWSERFPGSSFVRHIFKYEASYREQNQLYI